MLRRRTGHQILTVAVFLITVAPALSQVIEFRSNGLDYQALTKGGLTVMFARMPVTTGPYAVLQLAVSNGSGEVRNVSATDFHFEMGDGSILRAVSEQAVVGRFFRSADRQDMLELQSVYEKALYSNHYIRSNNGYEQRRRSALAIGSQGLKAAAAASAIAFVSGKLGPGDSTDGALFFPTNGQDLGPGKVVVVLDNDRFEFLSR